MSKLEGKVAVITGGNSSIGLATARRFAARSRRPVRLVPSVPDSQTCCKHCTSNGLKPLKFGPRELPHTFLQPPARSYSTL